MRDDAPAVLEMYRRLVANAPTTFTCVAALRRAPPAPWLPKEIHGTPIVALFGCDTGPPDEARTRAADLDLGSLRGSRFQLDVADAPPSDPA